MLRTGFKAAMWVAPLAFILTGTTLMVSGQTGVKNGEWPHWGADLGNTKYSALDQINRGHRQEPSRRMALEGRQLRAAPAEQP